MHFTQPPSFDVVTPLHSLLTVTSTLPANAGFSSFSPALAPKDMRTGSSMTLLSNGKVLFAGGVNPAGTQWYSTVELFDPSTNTITELAPLKAARESHTATLLSGDKVLIVGGEASNLKISSVELYDPAEGGTSQTLTPTSVGGYWHSATLLPDDKVLLTGGQFTSGCTTAVEVYDPKGGGSTTLLAPLPVALAGHKAILYGDSVIILGGFSCTAPTSGFPKSVLKYTLSGGGSFSNLSPLSVGRVTYGLDQISSTEVVLSGGLTNWGANITSSVEKYDFSGMGSDTTLQPMQTSRRDFAHVARRDGKILIAGGCLGQGDPTVLNQVELYDPAGTGSSVKLNDLSSPIVWGWQTQNTVQLADGRALLGQGNGGELQFYSPFAQTTVKATGGLPPYTYSLVKGSGYLYPNTGLFIPNAAGEVQIKVTDSQGMSAITQF